MVFFNYATMQMAAKIVYYGPGLCGKTTNLHYIYAKTSPQSRGEMVSLETETDRTLFFDLLPIEVGVIGGFKTRLQLYTVPGQVFYNTTRKLVLKGADGIVFVADSQRAMLDANAESFGNLRENLAEIGLNIDELPLVIQLNKRDLPNVASPAEVLALLDPEGRRTAVEASAVAGKGVFETLKEISKATIRTLRKRMSGDEPSKPAIQMTVRRPSEAPTARAAASNTVAFPAPVTAPTAPMSHPEAPAAAASSGATALAPEPIRAPHIEQPVEVPSIPPVTLETPVFVEPPPPAHVPEPVAPPVEEAPAPALPAEEEMAAAEPEVDFAQEEKPVKVEAPAVKHVKVRSNVDIMAELESLRKKATQTPPKGKRDAMAALDALASFSAKKPESHAASAKANQETAKRAKTVRVQVLFEDSEGNVLQTEEQNVTIESSAVQSLLVNWKVEITS